MKKKGNLSELMSFAGKHRFLTYASGLLSVIRALLALVPFVFLFLIVKEVIEVAPDFSLAENVVLYGGLAVAFALGSIIVYFGALMCSHLSAFRIAGNMRKAMMKKIDELPLGFIQEEGSGKIRRIVSDSSKATETYLAHQLPDMAGAIATPIGMIALLFVFDWRFGLVSLLPFLFGFATMFKMTGPQMAKDMRNYQNALGDMNNEAVEYVRGIPVVKVFNQTVHSFRQFKASIDNYDRFCVAYTKKCRLPMLFFTTFINSAFAFLIAFILILADGQAIGENVLMNFIFYVLFTPIISTALTKIMYMSENGMIVSDALECVHSILDREPLPESEAPRVPRDYSIEFDHVTFAYPGAKEAALKEVSFRVEQGGSLALVGPSGGGKTTVAGLISRFQDVGSGEIRIGGVNVKDIPGDALNETIAYVFQDSRLLKTSVCENVRLARKNATEEEVKEALHKARCDDILAKLPDGIDTEIGAKGIYLSGGEQQRIAIARMMLKDAPIVLLDEATAFADPENEVLLQEALKELTRGKTLITIAHRLTTVQNADRILVLKDGRTEEEGTHETLIRRHGLYAKMWDDYQTSVSWKVGGKK